MGCLGPPRHHDYTYTSISTVHTVTSYYGRTWLVAVSKRRGCLIGSAFWIDAAETFCLLGQILGQLPNFPANLLDEFGLNSELWAHIMTSGCISTFWN